MIARVLPVVAVAAIVACSASRTESRTQTTSADYNMGAPSLRTTDNTGWVDNGGRTRHMSAGISPNPIVRGDEMAPHRRERPRGDQNVAAPTVSGPALVEPSEFDGRAASALCDREESCGRIGEDQAYASGEACMTAQRDRVDGALGDTSCSKIRADRVAPCLTAIRRAVCEQSFGVRPPAECTAPELCGGE